MKVIIYSVNFGQYDNVWESPYWSEYSSYYISDRAAYPSGASLILEKPADKDLKRAAGRRKLLSHKMPEHDISLFIDGSVFMKKSLSPVIEWFQQSNHQVAIPFHPNRTGTYEEARACKKAGRGDSRVIDQQMDHYREQGLPESAGMVATTIILRKNTPDVAAFNHYWHFQITRWSKRDQLSVMYAAWKTGIKIYQLPINIYKNAYFKKHKHR